MEDKAIEDFYKEQFNIDQFLNDQTEKRELKDILRNLNDLKQKNSTTMSNVLKEQTDSVISIAEQLQSLHKKIDNLNIPILQLREEVKLLQARVKESVLSYDQCVLQNQILHITKSDITALRSFNTILSHTETLIAKYTVSSDYQSESLERLIYKFAFQSQMMACLNIEQPRGGDTNIDIPIQKLLADKFLTAFKEHQTNEIRRTIDMYIFLKKTKELIELIRDKIVKPLLEPILCEERLRGCNDVKVLYKEAIMILKKDLKILINITKQDDLKEFSVILDCYWVVVDELLRKNLLSITAAGHADAFFTNFTHTHNFLKEIAEAYGDKDIVKRDESFVSHLKRFNLLVYYEIRHQEVSSLFEAVALRSSEFTTCFYTNSLKRSSKIFLKLQVSLILYLQLKYLFHKNVFLPILSDQFLKSSMLLISRYNTWVSEVLENNKEENKKELLIYLLCDLTSLKNEVVTRLKQPSQSIFKLLDPATIPHIDEIISANNHQFTKCFNNVKNEYICVVTKDISKHLQNVTAIPRLYRRTNKNPPKEHSQYVEAALQPILELEKCFHTKNPYLIEENKPIMDEIICIGSAEFLKLVTEVLNSVCKTEESLRRLKSRNTQNLEDGKSDGKSDESKIRLQIKFDVAYFVDKVERLALDNGKEALQILLQKSN